MMRIRDGIRSESAPELDKTLFKSKIQKLLEMENFTVRLNGTMSQGHIFYQLKNLATIMWILNSRFLE
jgi:hypothetical protein